MNVHPIHVHLVQFQVIKRQQFNVVSYLEGWIRLNGNPPLNKPAVNVASLDVYLTGEASGPSASEQAWKDTVTINPGEVVTIRLRWTQQDGNPFPFDATAGPGYVWHCHLLEHEDNEMMRPYLVVSSGQSLILEIGVVVAVAAAVIVISIVLFRRSSKQKQTIPSKR
jgi:FtsP/CotA-like multicopper oxidase with cupredoxin domain